jgi:hypothetical protein
MRQRRPDATTHEGARREIDLIGESSNRQFIARKLSNQTVTPGITLFMRLRNQEPAERGML